ncbi:MAG: glutathione S-transferase family protein [Methylococcaceae bacterium]|nr:glutathione S-transferase family protein [Methylococcaceae bacterium]
MITLYEFALSGNCHKVRLMLSLLNLDYQSVAVNGKERQQKTPAFLALNPFGQVPVLADGKTVVRDSHAILVYLAKKYGADHWLPSDAENLAAVSSWLMTAANEVANGPNRLRLYYKFGRAINLKDAELCTSNLLAILNTHLSTTPWLATEQITIADLAVYPYIALAPEGNIDLALYPAIISWRQRIQSLPAYVDMPGIWRVAP